MQKRALESEPAGNRLIILHPRSDLAFAPAKVMLQPFSSVNGARHSTMRIMKGLFYECKGDF